MSFESVDIPPKNPPVDEQTIENSLVLLAVPDLDQANVLKCVTYLRQVLSEKSPPISKTIELGGIPLLLHVVTRFTLENPKVSRSVLLFCADNGIDCIRGELGSHEFGFRNARAYQGCV